MTVGTESPGGVIHFVYFVKGFVKIFFEPTDCVAGDGIQPEIQAGYIPYLNPSCKLRAVRANLPEQIRKILEDKELTKAGYLRLLNVSKKNEQLWRAAKAHGYLLKITNGDGYQHKNSFQFLTYVEY